MSEDNKDPILAYIPLYRFMDLVKTHYLHFKVDVVSLYGVSGIKTFNVSDLLERFKINPSDSFTNNDTKLDLVLRNGVGKSRSEMLDYFYSYFGTDYLFDNGNVVPATLLDKAHVLLVVKEDTTPDDYTAFTGVGEVYYRINELGNPAKCCLVSRIEEDNDESFDELWFMEEKDLITGGTSLYTVDHELSPYIKPNADMKYRLATFSLSEDKYFNVRQGDKIVLNNGIEMLVKSVEFNEYKFPISFKAVSERDVDVYIKFVSDGSVLVTNLDIEPVIKNYRWYWVDKVINQ